MYLTAGSLLFISPAAFKLNPDRVKALFAKLEAYATSREAKWKQVLRPLPNHDYADRLEALLEGLRELIKVDWSSQAILHVPGFTPSLQGLMDGEKPVIELSPLGLTAEDVTKGKARYMVPLVSLRIVAATEGGGGENASMTQLARWVLEDYVLLTMETFAQDVDECCKQILRLPVHHPDFDAIVIEVIFSQMLRLPYPPMLPLFYSRLLEGIAEKQESMKKVVQQVFDKLFERSAELDEDVLDVLAEALAYHMMRISYEVDWRQLLVRTSLCRASGLHGAHWSACRGSPSIRTFCTGCQTLCILASLPSPCPPTS